MPESTEMVENEPFIRGDDNVVKMLHAAIRMYEKPLTFAPVQTHSLVSLLTWKDNNVVSYPDCFETRQLALDHSGAPVDTKILRNGRL